MSKKSEVIQTKVNGNGSGLHFYFRFVKPDFRFVRPDFRFAKPDLHFIFIKPDIHFKFVNPTLRSKKNGLMGVRWSPMIMLHFHFPGIQQQKEVGLLGSK